MSRTRFRPETDGYAFTNHWTFDAAEILTLTQLVTRKPSHTLGIAVDWLFGNSKGSFYDVGCHRKTIPLANYVLKLARIFPVDSIVQYLAQKR